MQKALPLAKGPASHATLGAGPSAARGELVGPAPSGAEEVVSRRAAGGHASGDRRPPGEPTPLESPLGKGGNQWVCLPLSAETEKQNPSRFQFVFQFNP
jgi:hypothetical protein